MNMQLSPPRFIMFKNQFIIPTNEIGIIEKHGLLDINVVVSNSGGTRRLKYETESARDADFKCIYAELHQLSK